MLSINHFITSQANPHVVPFQALQGEGRGFVSAAARMNRRILQGASAEVLDFARRMVPGEHLRSLLSGAHAVASQEYASSDMHIHLPFRPALYARVLSNPTFKEFQDYIRIGEQATWPLLAMIRDRTRISRLIGTHIGMLMRRIAARGAARAAATSGSARSKPAAT
jgi:TAG lipase / steryl ester hydrolase / phospholipase A2 / LPA acyltransferase